MYAIHKPSVARRTIAVGYAVLAVLLLLTTTAVGQRETNTRPTPAPTPPQARPEPDQWPAPRPNLPSPRPLPPSSVVDIKSTLAELRENLALMETINTDLQKAVAANSSLDYVSVATNASDIRRLAIRVMGNLALRRNAAAASPPTPASGVSADGLKTAIVALHMTIQEFLTDPVLTHPRTVDAGELSGASVNLETIMSRSAIIQRDAEMLAANSGKAATQRIRSRVAPSTTVQLNLECNAWSMTDLLKRPSQIKGHDSVNIGVNVKTRRHKLAEQLLVSIDDCVDGEAYERAITEKMEYVAIVTDFISYEVKEKVFAYRVIYETGFARNGQVMKRFKPLVSFYYVDAAGDGIFELFKGPTSRLLPDWAADLARKH
jgi:hypothetical protein